MSGAPQWLTDQEAAAYIGMSLSYLRNGRVTGATGNRTPGPPFYRIGRRVRYQQADLDTWLATHRKAAAARKLGTPHN